MEYTVVDYGTGTKGGGRRQLSTLPMKPQISLDNPVVQGEGTFSRRHSRLDQLNLVHLWGLKQENANLKPPLGFWTFLHPHSLCSFGGLVSM